MLKLPILKYHFPEIDKTIFDYPLWKHLISHPSEEKFEDAWRLLFRDWFENCTYHFNGLTLQVSSPTITVFHGGFGEITEYPILSEEESFFYSGCGCGWSTDIIGQRFYLIDPKTSLPANWDRVKAIEQVKRYIFW